VAKWQMISTTYSARDRKATGLTGAPRPEPEPRRNVDTVSGRVDVDIDFFHPCLLVTSVYLSTSFSALYFVKGVELVEAMPINPRRFGVLTYASICKDLRIPHTAR